MTAILGLDPGITGAVAGIDGDAGGLLFVADLPVLDGELQGQDLYEILLPWAGAILVIEEQQAMGKTVYNRATGKSRTTTSASSAFRLGVGYGGALAVAAVAGLRIHRVKPAAWKPFLGLSAEKDRSLRMARELWPDADLRLVKHHGRAEALLLAYWGYRKKL